MAAPVMMSVVPTAPPAPAPDFTDYRLGKLRQIAGQYEIRPDFITRSRQLEGYEIVCLFDDSGSMSKQIQDGSRDPFGRIPTRWSEAQAFANVVVETATCLDPTGVDIRFLNRPGFNNIISVSQIQSAFLPPPNGYTPLIGAVKQIFREKETVLREGKLLLIILTDGEPTDGTGHPATAEFIHLLKTRPKNAFVSIIACTDDLKSVDYLNKIDRIVPGIDVSDDYASEKKEILKAQGPAFKFSFGDYVIKCLLGPIDPSFDNMDEKKLPTAGAGGCCVIC